MNISSNFDQNISRFHEILDVQKNFDIVYHTLTIADKKACLYFIDGFTKDEILLRLMQDFASVKPDSFPSSAHDFAKQYVHYGETTVETDDKNIFTQLLSGLSCLLIDGYDRAILIDCRTYPARGVSEPEKDKVLRGSRDGFVETMIFNTALIRRRIRDVNLTVEIMQTGESSHTDIAICYMKRRVDEDLLNKIKNRIENLHVDALTMNQESLAECIFPHKWFNPFPKFRFSERPDTAAASILEGNIVILVDNSPACMILPSSVFDIIEEADDYYFWLEFIKLADDMYVPLIFQLLILEFAIDGLRLAAVNTPSMLTTPLSVIAGIVLGEYSVKSGWFNSETMLYMAFVTIANYSQASFEMGYALKFMRVILLILTSLLNVWGFILGTAIAVCSIVFNRTIAGKSYIYPLIPFSWPEIKKRFLRGRLPHTEKSQR